VTDAPPWTLAEIETYAARHGLTGLDAAMLERLRDLADRVAATGQAVPRMPRKDDEPATVFALPLK
jgi:aspartyl-tRNA(Asn)/glutamyl-tRNA(Gln) amidotransferase subunit A